MKKLGTLLVLLFVGMTCQAQIINFPDANFKAKLLAANSSNTIASSVSPTFVEPPTYVYWEFSAYNSIDTNGDGEIQFSEAAAIKVLALRCPWSSCLLRHLQRGW